MCFNYCQSDMTDIVFKSMFGVYELILAVHELTFGIYELMFGVYELILAVYETYYRCLRAGSVTFGVYELMFGVKRWQAYVRYYLWSAFQCVCVYMYKYIIKI
jgi:hypothetical protein